MGGSTLAQDLSPSSGLIPFQERLPQSAFQCCVTIYVRAVVSTVMGKTEAEPRSFAIAGFGAGRAAGEPNDESPETGERGGGTP